MSQTLITSRDKKGLQAVNVFEAAYNKAGLNEERAQKLNERGDELQNGILELINQLAWISSSQERAHQIMGKNFFGIEEAKRHFGIKPTSSQLTALTEIPFSKATLQACKDSHILVAVLPLSILEIRERVENNLFYSHSGAWYNDEKFAKQHGSKPSWQLVRKTPVANSTNKTWDQQQTLLAKDEETPTARVIVYTIIGHFLATGERLFENIYVRCSDVDSGSVRVGVGGFGSDGLVVGNDWDDARGGALGLSSARKSD